MGISPKKMDQMVSWPHLLGIDATTQNRPTKSIRTAANAWWEAKQNAIDAALGEARKHPPYMVDHYTLAIEQQRLFAKWQRRHGSILIAQESESVIEWLEAALKSDTPPYPLEWQADPVATLLHNHWQQKDLELNRDVWRERLEQIKCEEGMAARHGRIRSRR